MNLPRRWQVCQILKLALRPAVCVLGLMCQKAHLVLLRGLCVLAEETFLNTFPRQLAIEDFSPERGCRWGLWLQSDPRRRDTFVRCLSLCVLMGEANFFLPCLSRTWNLKTIWYLVGMIELRIEFFFNISWYGKCVLQYEIPLWCHLEKNIFVHIGIVRRRRTEPHFSWRHA